MVMGAPSASVAKDSTPRSMPVSCPEGGNGLTEISAHEQLTYQPSASREIVTVLGVPSMGDGAQRETSNLGQDEDSVVQHAPLPNCL